MRRPGPSAVSWTRLVGAFKVDLSVRKPGLRSPTHQRALTPFSREVLTMS